MPKAGLSAVISKSAVRNQGSTMKLGVINLGCPKNTVDTEVMMSYLRDFTITKNPADADYILINTCGFLKASRIESTRAISDMLKNRKCKVIVAGCFVTKELKKLRKKFKEVYAWVGVNDISNIRKAVEQGGVYTDSAPCVYKGMEHVTLLNPYSAYVKISDGCNHRCSFCVIPSIKGKYRSRKIGDIAGEIKGLVDSGVSEINLISQDLTCYGRDNYGRPMIGRLMKEILKRTKKFFWLRLLYLYPDLAAIKGIVEVMAKDTRVCRYLDIPFQHISDGVLKSMKRGYTGKHIEKVIEHIKSSLPGVHIRTSFIAGYPRETEDDLKKLEDFIGFGYVEKAGIFAYSDEPGTHAYTLKPKINPGVIKQRQKRLALASAKVCYYNNSMETGKTKKVLVIGKRAKGIYMGRTEENAPDIDNYIIFNSGKLFKPGDFARVKVTGYEKFDLLGDAI
jgi:ribosomal protein S12 methylthiotransferase